MDDFIKKAAKVTEMLKTAKDKMEELHELYPDARNAAANNHDKKELIDNVMIAATKAEDALCAAPQQGGKRRKARRSKTQRKRNY